MSRILPTTLVALVAATTAGCAAAGPSVPSPTVTVHGRLLRVIDGDTIHVRVNHRTQRVRLLGLDAPELHRPRTPVQCAARASAAALARLVHPGQAVSLTTDPTQERYDRYRRLLAYARTSTRDLQISQLRDGWERLYTYHHQPLTHQGELRRAERHGRDQRRGAWRLCNGDFHRDP